MIGYLLSGSAQGVVEAVNRYLAGRSRHSEALGPSVVGGASAAWESEHPRNGAGPIALHHAMLAVA